MAEPARSKSWRSRRPIWRLVTLGGFVLLFVWRALVPRSPDATTQPLPAGAPQGERPKTAFEPTDWPLRPVALIYIAIPVLLVISCFVLIAAYPTAFPDVDRTLRIAPPGPRLQIDPQGDTQRFRAEEEQRLNTYYWIDKQKGIVHIPIEQAMEELATKGAPGFPKRQP
jgi:hypothetical protein